jgi:uncharacterized membrane protein
MRRFAALMCMAGVLLFSAAVGWVAADWPAWCQRLHWCGPAFPR